MLLPLAASPFSSSLPHLFYHFLHQPNRAPPPSSGPAVPLRQCLCLLRSAPALGHSAAPPSFSAPAALRLPPPRLSLRVARGSAAASFSSLRVCASPRSAAPPSTRPLPPGSASASCGSPVGSASTFAALAALRLPRDSTRSAAGFFLGVLLPAAHGAGLGALGLGVSVGGRFWPDPAGSGLLRMRRGGARVAERGFFSGRRRRPPDPNGSGWIYLRRRRAARAAAGRSPPWAPSPSSGGGGLGQATAEGGPRRVCGCGRRSASLQRRQSSLPRPQLGGEQRWPPPGAKITSPGGSSGRTQQGSMTDTRLGKIHISPATLFVIPITFQMLMLAIYDRFLVPFFSRRTGYVSGITHLQRIGIGFVSMIVASVIAAVVERKRKEAIAQMSLFWLAPQFLLLGVSDVTSFVGLLEFFNSEAPQGMKSIAAALFWCAIGLASLLATFLVQLVNNATRHGHQGGWLEGTNLNNSRLDLFYWAVVVVGLLGFLNYLYWAKKYVYRHDPHIVEPLVDQDSP